jgi:hypothetical protein
MRRANLACTTVTGRFVVVDIGVQTSVAKLCQQAEVGATFAADVVGAPPPANGGALVGGAALWPVRTVHVGGPLRDCAPGKIMITPVATMIAVKTTARRSLCVMGTSVSRFGCKAGAQSCSTKVSTPPTVSSPLVVTRGGDTKRGGSCAVEPCNTWPLLVSMFDWGNMGIPPRVRCHTDNRLQACGLFEHAAWAPGAVVPPAGFGPPPQAG